VIAVRYELDSYILFRRNQVFEVLKSKERQLQREFSFKLQKCTAFCALLSSTSYLVTHKHISKAVLEPRLEHMIT
jgi:hypothetical protein